MTQGACLIYLNLPFPDFNLANTPITAVQGYGMTGPLRSFRFTLNLNLNQLIVTDACTTSLLPVLP